jgi:hypothetical protein
MKPDQPKAQQMQVAVAEFVWHFAGPPSLSFKQRTELMKHRRSLLNDLARTSDAFVRQGLIADLREVSVLLGQPLPNLKYLGKDAKQFPLEV